MKPPHLQFEGNPGKSPLVKTTSRLVARYQEGRSRRAARRARRSRGTRVAFAVGKTLGGAVALTVIAGLIAGGVNSLRPELYVAPASAAPIVEAPLCSEDSGLDILSFNAGLLHMVVDQVPHVKERNWLIQETLPKLVEKRRPELVMLQEVWDEDQARGIAERLHPLGYLETRPLERRFPGIMGGQGRGLITFARSDLPIEKATTARFEASAGNEILSSKGYQVTWVRDHRGELTAVVNAHMQAITTDDTGTPVKAGQVEAHLAQIRELIGLFQQIADEGGSRPTRIAFGGDINAGEAINHQGLLNFRKALEMSGLSFQEVWIPPGNFTRDPNNPIVKEGLSPQGPPDNLTHFFLINFPPATTREVVLDWDQWSGGPASDHRLAAIRVSSQADTGRWCRVA